MNCVRGDVVRSSDPFKVGADRQRPWLILNNDDHPFLHEQYIALAISTKQYAESIELEGETWEIGGVPRTSFVSPWAVHSPRSEDIVAWQGRVSTDFVDEVNEALSSFID